MNNTITRLLKAAEEGFNYFAAAPLPLQELDSICIELQKEKSDRSIPVDEVWLRENYEIEHGLIGGGQDYLDVMLWQTDEDWRTLRIHLRPNLRWCEIINRSFQGEATTKMFLCEHKNRGDVIDLIRLLRR